MKPLPKHKSLILSLLMLFTIALATNANAYLDSNYILQNLDSYNTSFWSSRTSATKVSFNNIYDSNPNSFMVLNSTSASDTVTVTSLPLPNMSIGKVYNFSTFFVLEFSGNSGGKFQWGIPSQIVFEVSSSTSTLTTNEKYFILTDVKSNNLTAFPDGFDFGEQGFLNLIIYGNTINVYFNNTLIFSNQSIDINKFYYNLFNFTANQTTCGSTCTRKLWIDNISVTSYIENPVAMFNIFDEINNTMLNFTTFTGDLYDTNNNYISSASSYRYGYLFFNNLTNGSTYYLRYKSTNDIYPTNIFQFIPSSTFNNYTIYAINVTSGYYVQFNVKDYTGSSPIIGASIQINSSINNTYKTVYDYVTDSFGQAIPFINTNNPLVLRITKDGYVPFEGYIPVIVSPYAYTITLVKNDTASNLTQPTDYFNAYYTPYNTVPLTNLTYQPFNLYVSSSQNQLQYYGITANISGTVYNNISYNFSGGQINITTAPTLNNTQFNVTYYIKVNGFSNLTYTIPYVVTSYGSVTPSIGSPGYGSGKNVFSILRDKFSEHERTALVVIIALVTAVIMSFIIPVYLIIFVVMFIFGMFVYVNWVNPLVFGLLIIFGIVMFIRGQK